MLLKYFACKYFEGHEYILPGLGDVTVTIPILQYYSRVSASVQNRSAKVRELRLFVNP